MMALLVAAVLLLSHPFTGVRHDGTLYAGDALARLMPGEFQKDLYFYFGSQGRFTVLPSAYAWLIATFGLGSGTIVGMGLAFCLYLAATTYVVARLAPESLRLACILSVLLGWTLYGGVRIFGYSESFLTARSFAEPVVLFGVGALLRRRYLLCAVLLAIGLAVHPLVGLGGLLFAWLVLVVDDRRWLALGGVGALVIVALGLVGGGPFGDVFGRYDRQWLDLVQDVNAQAFVSEWSAFDFGIIVFNVTILWFVARVVDDGRLRSFVTAIVVAGLGATAFSYVAVDLLHSSFFGKLQVWRVLWLLQWSAMATLPLALYALWQRGDNGRVVALLLALGWMAPFSVAPALVALFVMAVDAFRTRFTISRTTTRLVGGVVALAACIIAVQYEVRVLTVGNQLGQSVGTIAGQALAMNLVLFAAALAAWKFLPRLGWGGPVVALVVFCASLSVWDQRGSWTRKLESYPVGTHIWPGLIEPDATVYWYRDLIAPWVLLGHGNYYTQQQASGAVFSRDMVVELDRRRKVTGILDFQEQICRMMNALSEKQGSCEPDSAAVKTVCDEGKIDYVVLQSSLENAKPLADFSTGVVENGYEKKFFLYRCSALKSG